MLSQQFRVNLWIVVGHFVSITNATFCECTSHAVAVIIYHGLQDLARDCSYKFVHLM